MNVAHREEQIPQVLEKNIFFRIELDIKKKCFENGIFSGFPNVFKNTPFHAIMIFTGQRSGQGSNSNL